MSFIKLDNNNFEQVTVALRPHTHFVSSSLGLGATGSVHVSPFRSSRLKEFNAMVGQDLSVEENRMIVLASPEFALQNLRMAFRSPGGGNISAQTQKYITSVENAATILKNEKILDVFRFDMPVSFNLNRSIKSNIKKVLMPYHRHRYDNCFYGYSNYHTLNFFDSETIPTGSAFIYPNIEQPGAGKAVYDLPTDFCLNFWINPRYSKQNYKTGTIFHLSSSICVSLVSGSSKDEFGNPNQFKIMLQLSQSADKPPSSVNLNQPSTNYPNDLIFTSSHVLHKNHWHNVTVQWSPGFNNRSGSIYIDNDETNFYAPSASLGANPNNSPGGLVVGNYYDGPVNNLSYLLNSELATSEGFTSVIDVSAGTPVVNADTFSHPLNAEIHEVKLYNKVFSNITGAIKPTSDLSKIRTKGPGNLNNLVFYVPPFFYPTSSLRDVHVSPFQTIRSTTDDPFNVSFSFDIAGKLINLENFTREFIVGQQPRHFGLFPGTINTTIQNITADQYTYDTGSNKKRNFTILPNDNGLFRPDYFVLSTTEMSRSVKFYEDPLVTNGLPDYSIISLEDMVPSSSLYPGLVQQRGGIFAAIVTASSNNPGVRRGGKLTIAQRTRDRSSDEVVIFDISNLYYGNRIHPGSFSIYEENLTGSDEQIKITLKDNERGSLYRADAATKLAKWNNVGNVFYDEGVCIIKSPNLPYISKDKTDITFRGEQNIHTLMFDIPAFQNMFNSSSNPTFKNITPSTSSNDDDLSTLYITTVNIHDDNFNIIMKANFAQPIFKTEEDEFIIRLKEDF